MRRTTNRDDRRRRVLKDERVLSSDRDVSPPNDGASRSAGPAPRYADAALVDHQPRFCDLLPIRPWAVLIWFLVGLTFVIGHATLYVLDQTYGSRTGIDLTPLRMTGPQTLSSWSSSFLLMASAVFAAIIVQFRRHRIDDYRGEYRVWYYFVAGLVVASINASIGGHQIAWRATEQATQAFEIRHAGLWLNALISIFVTCVGVRLLLEVRESRGTVATGLITASIYLFSWLVAAEVITMVTSQLAALSAGLARLMSHFLLMMTLVVYARFVFLDAQGQINHVRTSKQRKRTKKSSSSSVPVKASAAEAAAQPQPVAGLRPSTPAQEPEPNNAKATPRREATGPVAVEPDDDDEPSTLRMNKADRRRMRKQKRRDRRAA